jgi:hypothetical protein
MFVKVVPTSSANNSGPRCARDNLRPVLKGQECLAYSLYSRGQLLLYIWGQTSLQWDKCAVTQMSQFFHDSILVRTNVALLFR